MEPKYVSSLLAVSRCESCEKFFWYPREICEFCMGRTSELQVEPRGTVYSLTTVFRPPARFEGRAPYQVALVSCDGGFRMLAMTDSPLAIGARVSIGVRVIPGVGEVAVAAEQ